MKNLTPALFLCALGICTSLVAFAEFITPDDNPPFRRDQLPLDVDTMAQLSRQISTLGSTLKHGDPASEHSAAQCIAIAIALDPVNRQAITLRESFENRSEPTQSKDTQIASAKAISWRSYSWLSEKQSGKDANTLADCLGDVLLKLDPQHPNAARLSGEKGSWSQWVSPLEEFKNPQPQVVKNDVQAPMPNQEDDVSRVESSVETKQIKPEQASFQLKNPTIKSPLWLYNPNNDNYYLKLATVSLSHSFKQEENDFRFWLPDHDEDRTEKLRQNLYSAAHGYIEDNLGNLPSGGRVSFAFDQGLKYSTKRNQLNLSAAGMVLTHACLSGQEAIGVVIGIVEQDQKISSPHNVWELIRFLESQPPSRVVLPKSTEELLPSLIAMEKLSLFLKHDIFLAAEIGEMVAFSKKKPDPTTLAAITQFNEIRAKATTALGPFLANSYVLKRLETINGSCPQYASSRYLYMVGKGQRQNFISKKVLAHEIRTAIAPLDELIDIEEWNLRDLNYEQIQLAHEKSRLLLDPLERIIASDDRTLHASAVDLANSARTLARGVKTLNKRDDLDQTFYDKSARTSVRELRTGLPLLHRNLSIILGEKSSNE